MERENSRNTRNERSNDKRMQADAASFPGRSGRKSKNSVHHDLGRVNIGYMRQMNTTRLNDLYERGSI